MKFTQRSDICNGRDCSRRLGQFLDPALLLLLEQRPAHGYTLLSRMREFGLEFLRPTVVYRALRDMEARGWVTSTWEEEASQGPPRRIYALTPMGRETLQCCLEQLRGMQQIIEYFLALHAELAKQPAAGAEGGPLDAGETQATDKEASMKVVIPANGVGLDAPISSVFGRCPTFVFVDTETMECDSQPNPAVSMPGGAGAQATQFVLQIGAEAILAPNMGPNAFRVAAAAGVPVYRLKGSTVREAVDAFRAGELTQIQTPGGSHVGMGRGRGRAF